MEDKPRKPVAILIEGDSHSNTFTNVKVIGDMDAVVMRQKDGKAPHGNQFKNLSHIDPAIIDPNQESDLSNKRWFVKRIGMFLWVVGSGVISGGVIYWLGWN